MRQHTCILITSEKWFDGVCVRVQSRASQRF